MADEPTLPRIPPSKAAEAIFGPARKRARFDLRGDISAQLLSNSSDPAVFSSDDDPALDNYASDRRKKKKRYVGAWFAQHPASTDSAFDDFMEPTAPADTEDTEDTKYRKETTAAAPMASPRTTVLPPSPVRRLPKKRTLERQYDSGVWMGSGTADEDEAMPDSPPAASLASTSSQLSSQLSLAPPPPPPAQADFPPPPPRQRRIFQRVPSLAVSSAEKRVRSIIQECIEAGDEEISLIGLGLNSLSNATVEPLSGLVPIPVVAEGVAFEQKEPRLQIFLSNNELTRLPGALFNLEHLTVLSLRGNGLTELPPAIGKLRNLQSLNVSLNKLRYLPAELLPLLHTYGQGGRLTMLLAHPNRYFMPDEETRTSDDRDGEEGEDDADNDDDDNGSVIVHRGSEKQRTAGTQRTPRRPLARPTRVARSRVRYMDSTGKTWSDFAMQPGTSGLMTTEDLAVAPTPPWSTLPHLSRGADGPRDRQASGLTASRVPTLMELALEACYGVPQLGQLAELLPSDAPPQLARQLARARALREAGGAACSLCRWQLLVAPMTEWLEWWEFAKSDIDLSYLASTSASAATTTTPAPATATATAATTPTVANVDEAAVVGPDDMELLPFVWRGCSWGCVPAASRGDEVE
ncbi:leucine rich repeat domain containing protein [Grosmannia clavigera kw1407]|uniref:Leucine rich repeat domain containing protein n=1 Tax=Grosmannia clavigera (strain kw1407 / UAMH 11150) TaxID=655863 RepID=F0XJ80_GROCL|nr:leucine rich repeat domain containing protein [Grosmannia clavigera kw1407]EFX02160.1 leucine rich repeat domain containing protein [Grosmannia clavigera kw1407]